MRRFLAALALLGACREVNDSPGMGGMTGEPDAGTPPPVDPVLPDRSRHEAGPYVAYLGTLHDHHYGIHAGDDGGLRKGLHDEPGRTGSADWWAWRKAHPDDYVGGDAASAYARAAEAGLDFFALTPHNHLIDDEEHAAMVAAAGAVPDLIGIHGQEWSSVNSGNHTSVMGATRRVTAENGDYAALVGWLEGYASEHPGEPEPFLILDHPMLSSSDYGPAEKAALEYGVDDFPDRTAWAEALSRRGLLVELLSGDRDADDAIDRILDLLDQGLVFGFSMGPDSHRQEWGTRTEHRVAVLAEAPTAGAVSAALRARRTYVTEERDLGAHVAVLDGEGGTPVAWPGDEARIDGAELRLELGVEAPSHPDGTWGVEVWVDDAVGGGPARRVDLVDGEPSIRAGLHELTIEKPPTGGYLLVRLERSGRATWFSPIWFP